VAAGRADRVGRGHDARPDDVAGLDRLAQADVVVVGRADVAHGGEPGLEREPGVLGRDHRPERVGEQEIVVAGVQRRRAEVDVHVDQAGEQGHARERDARRPGGHGVALLADLRDPAIDDRHLRLVDLSPAGDVDQLVGGDDHGLGLGGGDEYGSHAEHGDETGDQAHELSRLRCAAKLSRTGRAAMTAAIARAVVAEQRARRYGS